MSPATDGSFVYTLPFADYLAANRLFMRRRWIWKGALRAFAFLAVLYILLFAVLDSLDKGTLDIPGLAWGAGIGALVAAVVTILMTLAMAAAITFKAPKGYREFKLEGVPTTVTFTAGTLELSNRLGTSTHVWSDLVGWYADERMILLLRTSQLYYAVPKDQVPAETLEVFHRALDASGVQAR